MKRNRILAALLAVLLLAACLSACAAKASYSMANTGEAAASAATAAAEAAPQESFVTTDSVAETDKSASSEASGSASGSAEVTKDDAASTTDYAAKIIYSGNLVLQSTEFDKAVAALESSVDSFGGFVESSNISGNTVYQSDGSTQVVDRVAYYTVRVPANRFKEYLNQLDGLGNVISSSKNAENVTSTYTDYEAHLDSLQTEQTRLNDLLDKAEDVDSLIALEQRLSDVRYEIESIQRSLRDLDLQISYSSVSVEIDEVEVYTPTAAATRTFGPKLSDALRAGWSSFVYGLQDFCVGFVSVLPLLLLLAAIACAIIFPVRAARRKRRAKKQRDAATDKPSAPDGPTA